MAILNKTGITNGSTIQSEHVTRTIDALTGVSTDTIVATGSFTGSFTGPLTGTASFATSASRAISSSFATSASRAVSSSFAVTASYALNATAGSTSGLQSLQFTHDAWVTASATPVYYGNYPAAPTTLGRVGVISPYTGTLVSASISGHMTNPGGGAKLSLWVVNGPGVGATSMSLGVEAGDFIDSDQYFSGFTYTLDPMAISPFTASFGDSLSIKLQSNGTVNGLNAYTTVTLVFK
jgi:hypothetical protein